MESLTVCIKTFLRDDCLYRCIDSLRKIHDGPIIVADDGEITDEKRQRVEGWGARYLELPFDVGLPAGRNAMVDAAETEFVFMADDDFVFDERANLDHLLKLNKVADIACGWVELNGGMVEYVAHLEFEEDDYERGLVYKAFDPEWRYYQDIRYCDTDLALNVFIARTELVRELAWDEQFKIAYEHVDFFLRAKEEGLRVVFCPSVVISHQPIREQTYAKYRYRHHNSEWRDAFAEKWDIDYIRNLSGYVDHYWRADG